MDLERFEWEKHKTELDRIFFKDFSLVPRCVGLEGSLVKNSSDPLPQVASTGYNACCNTCIYSVLRFYVRYLSGCTWCAVPMCHRALIMESAEAV